MTGRCGRKVVTLIVLLGMSLAGDVRQPRGGPTGLVVTGQPVVLDRGEVKAEAGAVDDGLVAGEGVAPAPAVSYLVGLEAVLRTVAPGVLGDRPVVALDVDPGVGADKRAAVEGVAGDQTAGGAFLGVDRLGGGGADLVAADDVAVAGVRLAAGD